MNVTAAGTGSPDLNPSAVNALANLAALARLSPHSHSEHDSVSGSLGQLTSAAILELLQIVEERVFPEGSQHVESIRTSSHFPIDGLYSRPAQALETALIRDTFDARDSAQKLVATAAHTIETAGSHGQRVPDGLDPGAVIALANQFIATGQLPNYLRAAELGRVVISWYDEAAPASIGFHAGAILRNRRPSFSMRFYEVLGRLWSRAPVLIVLIGWLLLGGLGGLLMKTTGMPGYRTAPAFKTWAIGFLALVVFQFVITIRGSLRPKPGTRSRGRGEDLSRD